MKLLEIPVERIQPNPKQPRKSLRGIKALAQSIEEVGLINPISAEKIGERYRIISGERRWGAYKYLKRKTIPTIVKKPRPFEMIAENVSRQPLHIVEKMEAIDKEFTKKFGPDYKKALQRLHMKYKKRPFDEKVEKACAAVGLSGSSIYCYLPIANLPEKVKEKIMSQPEYFSAGVVRKIVTLKKEDLQIKVSKQIIEQKLPAFQAMKRVAHAWFKDQNPDVTEAQETALLELEKLNKTLYSVIAALEALEKGQKYLPKSKYNYFRQRLNALNEVVARCL